MMNPFELLYFNKYGGLDPRWVKKASRAGRAMLYSVLISIQIPLNAYYAML